MIDTENLSARHELQRTRLSPIVLSRTLALGLGFSLSARVCFADLVKVI